MMHKNILYIGNNLSRETKYPTALVILVSKLKEENFNVIVSSNKQNKFLRLIDMIVATLKYKKWTDFIIIDTYSTTNFYFAVVISQLSRLLKTKYIPILHGGNLPKRLSGSRRLSSLVFNYSHRNIAPSNYLKSIFEKYGYNTLNIPNSINIKSYLYKKREILEPKLFWIRSFNNIYNPLLALEVLILLKKEYPNSSLCMVGPFIDDTYSEAVNFVKKNKIENAVEFTNVLSKEEWHKKSENYDIFINTSNIDNTPVSIIEAMALGLPIVSTNVGGIPYLIDDKKDGILVNPNSVIEMKEAIVSLLKGNYPNIAIKARKKAEMFDWQFIRHKWIQLLA